MIAAGGAVDRLTAALACCADSGPLILLPPVLLVAVALDDALLLPRAPSYLVLGLLDEPAHLATSLILLVAVAALLARAGRAVRTGFAVGLVLAGNLIDADHLPMVLGSDMITAGTPRPYSHSVTLLMLVILAALVGRGRVRAVAAGVAVGVAGHLIRDLGTAPIALLWPLSPQGLTVPHRLYLALLAWCALAPLVVRVLNPLHGPADTPH
jgi:inner membrane protein